jgi:hypothetical protein
MDAALEALRRPDRLRAAEQRVADMAPRLHVILADALDQGGWFEGHEAQVREATAPEEQRDRIEAVRALLAEETRLGMLVGVAVGWELARELEPVPHTPNEGD